MRLLAALVLVAAPGVAADPPRDPFVPYGVDDADDVLRDWPLSEVPVGALRLEGVVVGVASPSAMLVGPDGRGVVVKVGALVGKEGAQVKAVRRDRVVVETTSRSAIGEVFRQRHELQLAAR